MANSTYVEEMQASINQMDSLLQDLGDVDDIMGSEEITAIPEDGVETAKLIEDDGEIPTFIEEVVKTEVMEVEDMSASATEAIAEAEATLAAAAQESTEAEVAAETEVSAEVQVAAETVSAAEAEAVKAPEISPGSVVESGRKPEPKKFKVNFKVRKKGKKTLISKQKESDEGVLSNPIVDVHGAVSCNVTVSTERPEKRDSPAEEGAPEEDGERTMEEGEEGLTIDEGTDVTSLCNAQQLENLLKDHADVLSRLDNILNPGQVDRRMEDQQGDPSPEEEEEREAEREGQVEEDYLKEINSFVESETVDIERMYDLLHVNLQYQDFLQKLADAVEQRLVANRNKQAEFAARQDRNYLIETGKLVPMAPVSSRTPRSKILSLARYKAPYFCDSNRVGPRKNPDQLRLSSISRFNTYCYTTGWGKMDQKEFLKTLRSHLTEERVSNAGVETTEEGEALAEALKDEPMEQLSAPIVSWEQARWNEVALLMTNCGLPRCARDCELQWRNCLSLGPDQPWSAAENKELKEYVEKHGRHSWVAAGAALGRKPWQCLQRWTKLQQRAFTAWSVTEDRLLEEGVLIYGEISFADLSYYMGDKTPDQVLQRWRYSISPKIRRGRWSQEEDSIVMGVVRSHGLDWQKMYTVLKSRTRAQVKERVRILVAKERSGNNGGTYVWSVKNTLDLMLLIQKHGERNWAAIRDEMDLRYTAPVLFRRWTRIQGLLNGTVQRLTSQWESDFLREVLGYSKKNLTPALREQLAEYLPSSVEEQRPIRTLLQNHTISGRPIPGLKRGRSGMEAADAEVMEERELEAAQWEQASGSAQQSINRQCALETYMKAFEVGNDEEYRMFYTPPSITTLGALDQLLRQEIPYLSQSTGGQPVPESIRNSREYQLLLSRFKSLFSWPLIMGDTPV